MPHPEEHIRYCASRDGAHIAYSVCGEGPPLVWIAPWVHHLQFDWDSPVWRPWLSLLTKDHRVARYDWRGCGLSDRDGVAFSFENHVEDFAAVIESLGFFRFALVGIGSGGAVGLTYAARHPDRVTRLILHACPVRGRFVRADTTERAEEAQTRLRVFKIGWERDTPGYGHFLTALHMPDATAEQIRSYNDLRRRTTSPDNARALLCSFWDADIQDTVGQIRCPTLVFHSPQDALIPFEEGRLLASLIPGARFVPLDTRNHILTDHDSAWPLFSAEVQAFLEIPSDERPRPSGLQQCELTPREKEILEALAQGLDNTAIGRRLGISEKTVRNHVSTIFSKLGVNGRPEAIVRAREAGFGHAALRRA